VFTTTVTERLADHDDAVLNAYVDGVLGTDHLHKALVDQIAQMLVHPVYFGSAVTGDGVDALMAGLVELLPAPVGDPDAPLSGRIFKIERDAAGERIACVQLYAGWLRVRQRLAVLTADGGSAQVKPTAITAAQNGAWVRRRVLVAGEIGRLSGLTGVRIGDVLGRRPAAQPPPVFTPPTMETVVEPRRARDGGPLRAALAQLAEQDPLINVRSDETGREISVSLYGEVQKEVIEATLADEFGIEVTFRDTTTLCVERPRGRGEAGAVLNADTNPFPSAQIGLRVEPGPAGTGIEFRMAVDPLLMPLHVYRNAAVFAEYMTGYVRRALSDGLHGWPVTDCVVTMIDCWYSVADGPPSRRGADAKAADFRNLTPVVLARALEAAGTAVCEPALRVALEIPAAAISAVLTALGRLAAAVRDQSVRGDLSVIEAVLPAARVRELQRVLPALTAGEGVLESTFDGYRPVAGDPPTRGSA
jgi:ribosomal protection tetracycline resistance protein